MIINLVPGITEEQVKILSPIRFSIRDKETHIDPSSMRVKAGFAKLVSKAKDLFDILPGTTRHSLLSGNTTEPSIVKITEGIQITKTESGPQRSAYVTKLPSIPGYKSVMVSAEVRRDVIGSPSEENDPYSGTVIGLEYGPRNKVIYFWLQQHTDTTKFIRLTSYIKEATVPDINTTVNFNWSGLLLYTLLWDEAEGVLEVYGTNGTGTVRLFRIALSSIPVVPEDYKKHVTIGEIAAIYGQEGNTGDSSIWSSISITDDVSFPIIGNIRPGDFLTKAQGAEIINVSGLEDPRKLDIACWFDTPQELIPFRDSLGKASEGETSFSIQKFTPGKTVSIFRYEPGLGSSDEDGFMVEASLNAINGQQDNSGTGMGILIFDGQSVFQLQLLNDFSVRTVGLLMKGGSDNDLSEHYITNQPLDWLNGKIFRLVVDPKINVVRLYNKDLSYPAMEMAFDRSLFPSAADFGLSGELPFIAFGHICPINSTGTFDLRYIKLSHIYEGWDGSDGQVPNHISVNPVFTKTVSGSSSTFILDNILTIETPIESTINYNRVANFSANRGAIVEVSLKIVEWRRKTRTGTYVILDDGLHAYALTFVESNIGKFAALSKRSGLGSFQEIVGKDGEAARLSFQVDWTEFHTYRMERKPFEGIWIFLDDEKDPRIVFPEKDLAELPNPQFGGIPTIAFGQFTSDGSVTQWKFFHSFFSRGYEVSFKKNISDHEAQAELSGSQVIVITNDTDADL